MEENRANQTEHLGITYDVDYNQENESQEGGQVEHDTLNGNNLLRQLLADEIAEGM